MSIGELETTLRNLPTLGQRVLPTSGDSGPPDQPERWRFEHNGKRYELRYYPRRRSLLGRLMRGNPALAEFARLQTLQKAGAAVPRASTVLVGFRLQNRLGDALITDAVDPSSVALDELVARHEMSGTTLPARLRYSIIQQAIKLLRAIGKAGFGDPRLALSRFMVDPEGKVWLADTSSLRPGGLRSAHVMALAHDARSFISRAEAMRAWEALGDAPLPANNLVAARRERSHFDRGVFRNSQHFGRLCVDGWQLTFTRRAPRPLRWADRSAITALPDHWRTGFPELLHAIQAGTLDVLKRDDSGDVLAGSVRLGGQDVHVIVKRPLQKKWYQPVMDLVRGSRAARTWKKTWQMIVRDIPCELPLLLAERRVGRFHAAESILVFQRVPGHVLSSIDLDALAPEERRTLFRRAGRALRAIDDLGGFTHSDAKSTNWIIYPDPLRGLTPVLVDLYGIRLYSWSMLGLNRLLRAMKQHRQYTPEDSFQICSGYAPDATPLREPADTGAPSGPTRP